MLAGAVFPKGSRVTMLRFVPFNCRERFEESLRILFKDLGHHHIVECSQSFPSHHGIAVRRTPGKAKKSADQKTG